MRDEEDRPLVLLEGVFEKPPSVEVEVRRRFVKEKKIRSSEEKTQKRKANLLAAGKDARGLLDVVFVEAERAELVAKDLLWPSSMRVPCVLRVAVDGEVWRYRLGKLLAQIAGNDIVSDDGLALGRLSRPSHYAHKRRLAEAVVADERDLVAARHVELETRKDILYAVVAEAEVFATEHLYAARRRLREPKPAGLRVALRKDDPLLVDLVDELLAALRLRGLRRLRTEAVDEPLKLLAVVILVLLGGLQVLVPDLALLHVPVEIALVARRSAGIDFDRDVRQRTQEIAVVGDQHQRSLIRLEVLLEPVDGGEVEVVGRLVEEKEIGLGREHARQFRAHAPAAGKRLERLRELLRRKTEAAERDFHASLDVVAAEMLELRLQLAVALHLGRVCKI